MKAVSLTMASLMALLIASFACACAFAFPFPFPAAGTAKDKESIPFVPEHDQQPAPILPRSSTAVLDFGDALLHEGGNSRPVVKPTPQESPASSIVISSSKDNDDETEKNTNHPQQQQPEKQGKPIHHDDADDEAGGSSSSFRNKQVSIDDASEQVNDLVAFGHAAADASVLGVVKLRFARNDITSNVQQLMVGKKGKEGADKMGEADEDEDDGVTRTGMGMEENDNDNDGDGGPVIVGHKKRRPIIPHQHQPPPTTDPNNTVPVPTA